MKLVKYFIVVIILVSINSFCQKKDSLSYEFLTPPSVPGFAIIDKDPTLIHRPKDPSDFAVTLLQNSNNLGNFPKDFAIEFTPYWLFGGGKNVKFEEYAKSNISFNSALQSLTISVSTSPYKIDNDTNSINSGIGINFSIVRGKIDEKYNGYLKKIDSITAIMSNLNNIMMDILEKRMNDIDLNGKTENEIKQIYDSLTNYIKDSIKTSNSNEFKKIKSLTDGIKIKRIGWKLDFTSCLSYNFKESSFDKGHLEKYGNWLTGGYEANDVSFLGVFRYIGDNSNSNYNNISTGCRLTYENIIKNVSFSGEGVYKLFPNLDVNKDQWRFILNIDYSIGSNKTLSFSYGRDFKGKTNGNLVSMLNLILGFGSVRPNVN
jgi:hypothetical protein